MNIMEIEKLLICIDKYLMKFFRDKQFNLLKNYQTCFYVEKSEKNCKGHEF